MLVAGANRHAVEIVDILNCIGLKNDIYCYDDVSKIGEGMFLGKFPIIQTEEQAKIIFSKDPVFVLGIGNVHVRKILAERLSALGGKLQSVISPTAQVGAFEVELGEGLNIMHFALISSRVHIGEGTLINAFAAVHHDVNIGSFCEISPRATLLGGVKIGNFVRIGSGAVILPNISIGDGAVVGAGAVVTKNIGSEETVVGFPAKKI